MSALLEAEGLTKRYGAETVVAGLDLRCEAGEVLGLLGPNGAGKTTTLRMLYGFATPDAGRIRYEGRDFAELRTELKRVVGVCTQEDTLDYDFDVRQNLRVYASYFRPRVPELAARVDELLEQFGLARFAGMSPHALSGGYKRRLLIARSIVHRPKILFLDEPTTGLDPAARVDVWELTDQLRRAGMGIILTTHYMDEAERLSDRLLVLQKGKQVASGATQDILDELLGDHVLVLPVDDPAREAFEAAVAAQGLSARRVLRELHVPVDAAGLAAIGAALPGTRLTVRPPTLDDLFLALADEEAP